MREYGRGKDRENKGKTRRKEKLGGGKTKKEG